MRKKTKIIIVIVGAVLVLGGIFAYSFTKKSPAVVPVTDIIFFYGRECPHCQDVEKFLEDNKIAEKIKFDSVEVWHNQQNADLLLKKTKECGISEDKVGVPFVFSAGKCFIGASDAETFFKEKAGL